MRYAFMRQTAVAACVVTAALTAGQGTLMAQGRSQPPPPTSAIPGAPPSTARSASPGTLPDVVGLRTGMGLLEAYNLLKAYDSQIVKVQVDEITWPQLGEKPIPHLLRIPPKNPNIYACEEIEAEITVPPSKQVVWYVGRQLTFQAEPGCGKETALSSVLGALREKYGQESSADPQLGHYEWLFDDRGQRVAGRSPDQCSSFTGSGWGGNHDARLVPPEEGCRFVIVHALFQKGATPALVKILQVTMINPAVGVTASLASKALSASVDAAAAKRELDEAARQGRPKL